MAREGEREMEIDVAVHVSKDLDEEEEEEEDSSEEEEEGARVRIGFLLEDKLKVFGEGENASEVIMKQRCYEQKIIYKRFSEIEDKDNFQQLVHRMLLNDMHMHPQSAEIASPLVATTILDKLVPTSETHNGCWTILLEVLVECSIKKHGGGEGEPSGEHGYARLQERLDDEDSKCSICREEFSSSNDITVTTCHHIFHRPCIIRWLSGTNESCPICRFDLAPMVDLASPS